MTGSLSAAERERLLDAMQDEIAAAPRESIPPRPAGVPAPASFAQRRLWFLDRFDPANSSYNLPVAVRLLGALDRSALERAITTVAQRHDVLRTTFAEVGGEPVQVVGDVNIRLEVVEADEPVDVTHWLATESFRLFDLATGPLLRCCLMQRGPEEAVLLVCAHHSVVDGWSMAVLFDELAECYAALTAGRLPELAPLPIQYADFAAWQRAQEGAAVQADLAYWTRTLAGAPPALELPGDEPSRARGEDFALAGDLLSAELPDHVVTALHRLSAAEQATTFMTVLAAAQLLLGRLAGAEDVVVGVPIAARPMPELEPLIGNFLNTLAIRTDLSGEPTFRQLLQRVRRATIAAYDHQSLPFERLVEELAPERVASRAPIYQVLVNHTATRPMPARLGDLRLEAVGASEPPSKLPLTIYVRERRQPPAIGIDILYQTAGFSRERMTGLLHQLKELLLAVSDDPDRTVGSYSLVAGSVAGTLPDLAAALPAKPMPTLRSMVEEWVTRAPDLPAVECGSQLWTYGALWSRSEMIRHALTERGFGEAPQAPVVAVTGPRCPATVAAMLAVLAGGGVLLTLDPALPRQRRQQMLAESGARYLVSITAATDDSMLADGVEELRVAPDGWLPVENRPAGAPPPVRPADEALYLFFTSGTTGVPKGVLGRHAGLTHFLTWQRDTFAIGPGDRCAHLTGLSFDVVLRDVLLPLVSGATLCIPAAGEELPVAEHLPWLAEHRLTTLHTVPTLARAYLTERRPGTALPAFLRLAFFAGEPLNGEVVRAWRDACGGSVVNLYGPTETTLAKCWYLVPEECGTGAQPIGAALPDAQAVVLTAAGALAGVGEAGQIVIRTPYRSLGYLRAEDEGRWQVNPATGDPSDLLYLTGDLGRLRPDGSIDILGRLDRQVKIRGVRIETEEVASVIGAHPGVHAAVVAAQPGRLGELALVAYVVPATRPGPTAAQLGNYVAKRLPSAMVPAAFVFIDEIPRTPNGKTDWRALPPAPLQTGTDSRYLAPRTPSEVAVAGIVASLLGVERVGVNDNFFALGGHSLLAMRLVARIASSCGVTLPLRAVFETPTVSGIAEAVDAAGPAPTGPAPTGPAPTVAAPIGPAPIGPAPIGRANRERA